jgi:hypothetical protein
LTLVDLALLAGGFAEVGSRHGGVSAEFRSYTDPRLPFDIVVAAGGGSVEFVQNEEVVAVVHALE